MKTRLLVLSLALGLLAVAGDSHAQTGRRFMVPLRGSAEVPGPGDPDARGTAMLSLDPASSRVCFGLAFSGLDTLTAAHLHRGRATESGPVVIMLPIPRAMMDTTRFRWAPGGSADTSSLRAAVPDSTAGQRCVAAERDTILEILRNPELYYVNVHTTTYPDGAIRGQLSDGGARSAEAPGDVRDRTGTHRSSLKKTTAASGKAGASTPAKKTSGTGVRPTPTDSTRR